MTPQLSKLEIMHKSGVKTIEGGFDVLQNFEKKKRYKRLHMELFAL